MHPVLFRSEYFTVYSYGVCVALAAALAWFVTAALARRLSYPPNIATDCLFVLFVSGVLGARLFYVLQHPSEFTGRWHESFYLQNGGLVWYGGLLAAVSCGLYYAKKRRLSIAVWADLFAPVIPLAHSVGRVGCFLNGCCFGKAGHPVQLYESTLLVALSAFLFARLSRRKKEGEVFAWYLAGYGTMRFALEFLRGDQTTWMSLTLPQWISICSVFAGVWLLSRPSEAHASRG